MYAVYVVHEVVGPWIEWFDTFEEALNYYHDMHISPEHTATLLETVEVPEE